MIDRSRFLATLLTCFSLGLINATVIHTAHASQNNATIQQAIPGMIRGKVTDMINSAGYTYAEVDTGSEKAWAAAPTTPLKIGDTIAFSTQMPMKNFHSNSMKRDFPVLYFVGEFITNEKSLASNTLLTTPSPHGQIMPTAATEAVEGINKAEGGHTIAEVYADKQKLNGKTLRLRGKVTKVTLNVMGKNWLHLRDSSSLDDITVTTSDTATIGDIVIIEGRLSLDKDFGYGYVYPLIVEDSSLTRE